MKAICRKCKKVFIQKCNHRPSKCCSHLCSNRYRKVGKKPKKLIDRFNERVMPIPEIGCYIWTGAIKTNGYGYFRVGSKYDNSRTNKHAHRLAWELVNGNIPKNKCILHKCDTTACVRIEHLWLGTHKENTQDMLKKNRGRHRLRT